MRFQCNTDKNEIQEYVLVSLVLSRCFKNGRSKLDFYQGNLAENVGLHSVPVNGGGMLGHWGLTFRYNVRETLLRRPVWRQKNDLLRSVPGVGEQVSVPLLAYFPELGTLDRKQIAPLVGVALINRDGGIMRGRRTVWGGRSRVMAALYTGTLVATRYNPVIWVFYQRLLAAGKAEKVTIVACMRKLLSILNIIIWYHDSLTE